MATAGGANIAVDGLVFGYDTGYPLVSGSSDTYKFNRGEPTENLIANTNLINVVAGTFTTDSTVDGVRILENDQVNNSHVMWNSATGFIITCSSGAYITVSAEYKTDCTIRMRFRDNPYDAQYDIDGGNIATISEQGVDFNTNGEWKRYSLTAQTATANPDLWWYLVDYRTNNEFGRVEIRNWQIEVKSHATPFTTETRSVSGSLIDLTRTTDIDLSNVSFDSNAQMTFDGTDDVININFPTLSSDSGSIEVVVSREGTVGNSFVFAKVGDNTNRYYLRQPNSDTFDAVRGNPLSNTSFGTLTLGKYYHLVMTWDSSTVYAYKNGVLQSSNSYTNPNTDISDAQVGDGPGSNIAINLPILKLYNRTLNPSEILQNYNAVKERFSL